MRLTARAPAKWGVLVHRRLFVPGTARRLAVRISKWSFGTAWLQGGTIWVSLDLLPVEVAMVLYVVTASSGSVLGSIAHDMSLVVDFNGNVQLGEILAASWQ